jgi:carbamoyl-phosphate synthase large subunit
MIGPGSVLVTSISSKVPLLQAVRRALGDVSPQGRLVGVDRDPAVVGRWFVDVFHQAPDLEASSFQWWLDRCREDGIRWIVPTRDGELLQWARWKPALAAADIHCMVPEADVVEKCLDKLRFPEAVGSEAGGLAVPYTGTAPDREGIPRWVVKERFGAGSRGVICGVSAAEALAAAPSFQAPVFQAWVCGVELSADLYVSRQGRPLGCVLRRREVVVRGESQVTSVVEDRDLARRLMELACRLGVTGHAVFQVMVEPSQTVWLLECNCRFGGASTLALAAGLDSFRWFFEETLGRELPVQTPVLGTPGLRQVRYPADLLLKVEPGEGGFGGEKA